MHVNFTFEIYFKNIIILILAIFQKIYSEISLLRIKAARAMVEAIHSADTSFSNDNRAAALKISADVIGLGPNFHLILSIENIANRITSSNLR